MPSGSATGYDPPCTPIARPARKPFAWFGLNLAYDTDQGGKRHGVEESGRQLPTCARQMQVSLSANLPTGNCGSRTGPTGKEPRPFTLPAVLSRCGRDSPSRTSLGSVIWITAPCDMYHSKGVASPGALPPMGDLSTFTERAKQKQQAFACCLANIGS